jgi:hypothetical protein
MKTKKSIDRKKPIESTKVDTAFPVKQQKSWKVKRDEESIQSLKVSFGRFKTEFSRLPE